MTSEPAFDARLPLLEREQVPAEVAVLYDQLLRDRGVVPNMFRTLAHVPALVLEIAAFLKPLMGEGALPCWYKELVATRVAMLNQCDYCTSAHRLLARQRGATEEQIESLDRFESGPFTERDRVGLRYAGLLHESGHAIDDAAFLAVRTHFNTQEIVELTAVAAAFEFFSRMNSALRIPVTPVPDSI